MMLALENLRTQLLSTSEPTLFSQARFADVVVRAISEFAPSRYQRWSVDSLVGVQTLLSYGRRSISLCPFGLYAHPSRGCDLSMTVRDVVSQLKTLSTVSFEWNVRFDHDALANELLTIGITSTRTVTHVLTINDDYEATFGAYNSTARNLVRRAKREGLLVRTSRSSQDVNVYYDIYLRVASAKGTYRFIYPRKLFHGLLELRNDVAFIVAEYEGRVIAGGWFFRDGDGMLYWHAAMNAEFSKYSPMYGIVDHAIRMAHDEGRKSVNFGGSSSIRSLEEFKNKWGAEPTLCWRFQWHNPFWKSMR